MATVERPVTIAYLIYLRASQKIVLGLCLSFGFVESSIDDESCHRKLIVRRLSQDLNGMGDLFDALSIDQGDLPGEEDPDDGTPQ